jgi:hypothetical protein
MRELMTFALLLLKKLINADSTTRSQVAASLREIKDTGLIPLGMRSDGGMPEYVWLLFDRSRLTITERMRHVSAKTPPGVRTRTIEI